MTSGDQLLTSRVLFKVKVHHFCDLQSDAIFIPLEMVVVVRFLGVDHLARTGLLLEMVKLFC